LRSVTVAKAEHVAAPNSYEPLEESFKPLKDSVEAVGGRIEFGRSFVRITDLGRQFSQAGVIEKGAGGATSGSTQTDMQKV